MADKLIATARLQKLILDSLPHIADTLSHVVRTEELSFASRTITLFALEKKCHELTHFAIKNRVAATESMEELVVQNTLDRHIIQDVFFFLGKAYVKENLGTALKKLLSMKKNLAPDPKTSAMSDEAKTKLGEILKEVLSSVISSVDLFPIDLARIVCFAREETEKKWNNPDMTPHSLIAFIFGHLIIPAILYPHVWGISKDAHSPDSSRAAIILTKVLKRVANGTYFEEAAALATYNGTSKKFQPKLKEFIDTILSKGSQPANSEPINLSTLTLIEGHSNQAVVEAAFLCLHYCLYIWKDAINDFRNSLTKVPPAEARIFFDLMGILEEIELIEGKPEPITDFTLLGFEKSTKPPSKATMRKPAAATPKTGQSGRAQPYVRQLSEKWNREHQQLMIEQKKRVDAHNELQTRKKQRESEREARMASSSSAISSPSKPIKSPRKTEDDNESSIEDRSSTPSRLPLARSMTEQVEGTTKFSLSPRKVESSELLELKTSTQDHDHSDHETEIDNSTTQQTSMTESADQKQLDSISEASPTNSACSTGPIPSYSDQIPNVAISITSTTEKANSSSETSNQVQENNQNGEMPLSPRKKRKPKPDQEQTESPSKTSRSDRKSIMVTTSPKKKKRLSKDNEGSESETKDESSTKSKKPRASRRTVQLTEEDIVSGGSKRTRDISPKSDPSNNASPSKSEPTKTEEPKLTGPTIISIQPNPTLNTIDNTPVTPRTAERIMRERSNTVSMLVSPRTASAKQTEKALGILGLDESRNSAGSVAQVVRELGIANAKLLKDLESANQERARLEKDIVRLRQYNETKTRNMSEFHSKLTSSILYRREKDSHLRRLTMHCKRTFNPSVDDNLWDFRAASFDDRRAVLASTIYSRAGEPAKPATLSGRLTQRSSATGPWTRGSRSNSKDSLVRQESTDNSRISHTSSPSGSVDKSPNPLAKVSHYPSNRKKESSTIESESESSSSRR